MLILASLTPRQQGMIVERLVMSNFKSSQPRESKQLMFKVWTISAVFWGVFCGPATVNNWSKTASAAEPQAEQSGDAVSFVKQIAPILVARCGQCHVMASRGKFSMSDYVTLMQGSAAGKVVFAGAASSSRIVEVIESGDMPRGGGKVLPDEFALLKSWIDQGAKFDGMNPRINLAQLVSASAKPDSKSEPAMVTQLSSDDLRQTRRAEVLAMWKRSLPNTEPTLAESNELILVANLPELRVQELRDAAELTIKQVKKQLSVADGRPLVLGGMAMIVLKSRYDYSEFGRMVEKRELPKQWFGHWRYDGSGAYAVLLNEPAAGTSMGSLLQQLITSVYLATLPEVPTWFAEGVGRNAVVMTRKKEDQRVQRWIEMMPAVAERIPDVQSLLKGELDEETTGNAGMAITHTMMTGQRGQFNKLLKLLGEGQPFSGAMSSTFGSPEQVLNSLLHPRQKMNFRSK